MSPEGERRVVRIDQTAGNGRGPIQILALVAGIVFAVLGGVALLRTGLGGSPFEPTTSVAGLAYTPLLGVVELAFGMLLLATGAFPRASDGVVFLGVLALVFGLIIVIEPGAFQRSLAAGRAHGWFYVVSGGVLTLTALVLPGVQDRMQATRHVERERTTSPTNAGRQEQGPRSTSDTRDTRDTDTRRLDGDETRT